MMVALLYGAIAILTIASPWWSLLVFVVVSPWQIAFEAIGIDYRSGWAVLIVLCAWGAGRKRSQITVPRAAVVATCAFLALAAAGVLWKAHDIPSDEKSLALSVVRAFFVGSCSFYSIVKLTNSSQRAAALAGTTACALAITSCFGLFQAKTSYLGSTSEGRIGGCLGNANTFAAYLAMGIIVLAIAWRLKVSRPVWHLAVIAVAGLVCILTFSRMGTVACGVGLWLVVKVRKSGMLLNWRGLAWGVLIASLAGGTVFLLKDTRRAISMTDDPKRENMEVASQAINDLSRLEAVEFAMRQWLKHPLTGVGLGTLAARNYAANGIYVNTHDTYAQALAGTGLIGAGLLVLALVSIVRSVPAGPRRFLAPTAAAIALCSFFADFLGELEHFVLFGILIAILRHVQLQSPAGNGLVKAVAA